MSRPLPAFLAALAALGAGCTLLLDSSQDGLPCDADNACLTGYVCDARSVCVLAADGACRPACGAFETCFKGTCKATCDKRPCGAAQTCSGGVCLNVNGDRSFGAACSINDDCNAPAFCLKPYGGGSGLCTVVCAGDQDCSAHAPSCRPYPDGAGNQIKLCAVETFTGCTREADCAAADLSCGLFSVTPTKEVVQACRVRMRSGFAIGETCSQAIPCANGLCLPVGSTGDQRCLTPCGATGDCDATLAGQEPQCLAVTVNPHALGSQPRARAAICVPGGPSQLVSCAASAGACHADAPDCVLFTGDTGTKCAQACADGGVKCPGGLHCVAADKGSYCNAP